MTGLQISPDLELPLDLVTEATAIVATRGAGKSSAGAVLVEEAIDAGVQTIVIDWTGVFWGLRSSAKGDNAGLAVYVLGGPHGDVPLEASAGSFIADLVVDSGHSFVLDLSDFTKGQMRRFCADFLERLYDRKARNRTTMLLLIDEAHELAPQSPRGGFKGDAARLIGAMEQVAALGRSRGLGVVMITQRTQALNKAVLDLIETLLVMRMLSPRAVAAVRDWIVVKNEDDEHGVLPSLPQLPTGTAWVWSPLRGILQKVAVRRIRTFDSYATPKPGQVRVEPKARRELDLTKLGEQMAATVERANADDPVALRTRIRELERDVEKLRNIETPEPPAPEVRLVHVPVLTAEVLSDFTSSAKPLSDLLTTIGAELQRIHDLPEAGNQGQPTTRSSAPRATTTSRTSGRAPEAGSAITPKRQDPPAAREMRPEAAGGLPKAQGILLNVLAQHGTVTFLRLSLLSGYSSKSSGFKNSLGALRSSGYAVGGRDAISITPEGRDALGPIEPLPEGRQLVEHWMGNLGKAERILLVELLEVWPNSLTFDELSDASGYSSTSSGYKNSLGRLRSLQLASGGRDAITAATELGEAWS